jgi:UDP-3-O-[3-hydroxymyristoyl] glucosamine N-acyltransferase
LTKSVLTADSIASSISELLPAIIGDGSRRVIGAAPLSAAVEGALLFVRASGGDLDAALKGLSGGVTVICGQPQEAVDGARLTLIVVDNPRLAFARAVNRNFAKTHTVSGVHPSAVVDASARIHSTASIGPLAVIGAGCVIGAGSVIHAHVVLYDSVRVGENVVIHSGTVIGADGFGYERAEDGTFDKFPHIGGVVIEADVEIGSNTSIDRGALADTLIKRGAKIDNQCHISHNVVIGQNAVVIAQSMLGGSVVIGDGSWVAPSACIMNQRKIGAGATVGLQALVVKDVPAGQTAMGAPAVSQAEFQLQRAALKRLTSQ